MLSRSQALHLLQNLPMPSISINLMEHSLPQQPTCHCLLSLYEIRAPQKSMCEIFVSTCKKSKGLLWQMQDFRQIKTDKLACSMVEAMMRCGTMSKVWKNGMLRKKWMSVAGEGGWYSWIIERTFGFSQVLMAYISEVTWNQQGWRNTAVP